MRALNFEKPLHGVRLRVVLRRHGLGADPSECECWVVSLGNKVVQPVPRLVPQDCPEAPQSSRPEAPQGFRV